MTAVPLPNNPLREVNSYYIPGRDGERNILIDTGFNAPESRAALCAALSGIKADMSKTDVLLTHMHADHSGLAPHITAPGARILVSSTDIVYLQDTDRKGVLERRARHYLRAGFPAQFIEDNLTRNPASMYAPGPSEKYTPIEEGNIIRVGGFELECIFTPGHTPGQMCYYDKTHKLMFTGDHVLFDITPNITSWEGTDNALGLYIDSLRRIRRYDVKVALPGHRTTHTTICERIDEILEHHRIRLGETFELIRENPGSSAYDLASRMTWRMRCSSWEDFPISQKWYAVGEAASHVEYLLAEGKITREYIDGVYRYSAI